MSYADEVFIANCKDILENGTWDTDYNVRPHWEDGTSAHTIKKFGIVNRYDLSKEFPAMTLRKTFIKSATDELLWIWQKNRTTSTTSRGTSGTLGLTRTAASARHTAISSESSTTIPRATSTRLTEFSMTSNTTRSAAAY